MSQIHIKFCVQNTRYIESVFTSYNNICTKNVRKILHGAPHTGGTVGAGVVAAAGASVVSETALLSPLFPPEPAGAAVGVLVTGAAVGGG